MKTELRSFLLISGYHLFHEKGTFEEKKDKAIAALELDDADRSALIVLLTDIINSSRSDKELKNYWDSLGVGVGLDKPKMVRWWLRMLVEALQNSR